MKFNLLTYSYVTSLYRFLSIVFLHQSHFIFYFCIILYTVTVYAILTQLFQHLVKTGFVQSNYWANKFVNLSSPISLAFSFKCYFILLILIYDKIQLSLTAVCPSSPCKNCSLAITMPIVSLCSTAREHARRSIVSLVCSVYSVRGGWSVQLALLSRRDRSIFMQRGRGREGNTCWKDQNFCKPPPADHLNSKWPPYFIQYLRDDPPPPPHTHTHTTTTTTTSYLLLYALQSNY